MQEHLCTLSLHIAKKEDDGYYRWGSCSAKDSGIVQGAGYINQCLMYSQRDHPIHSKQYCERTQSQYNYYHHQKIVRWPWYYYRGFFPIQFVFKSGAGNQITPWTLFVQGVILQFCLCADIFFYCLTWNAPDSSIAICFQLVLV